MNLIYRKVFASTLPTLLSLSVCVTIASAQSFHRLATDHRAVANHGGFRIVVGEFGKILVSDAYGARWRQILPGTSVHLNDVIIVDGSSAIVVGDKGAILRSFDRGSTWNSVSTSIDENLRSIAISPDGIALGVGDSGRVLRSDISFSQWVAVEAGAAMTLRGLLWLDSVHVIAVGDSGAVLTSSDGGSTWASVETAVTADLHDVIDAGEGVAVAVGAREIVLRSTDRGASWLPVIAPGVADPSVVFRSLAAGGGQSIVAAGYSSAGPVIRRSTDRGVTWSRETATDRPGRDVRAHGFDGIAFDSNGVGTAVGSAAFIVTSGVEGGVWNEESFSPITPRGSHTGFWVRGIGFSDTVRGVLAGPDPDISGYLQTLDGGATWRLYRGLFPGQMADAAFPDPAVGYLVGGVYGTWLRSVDSGVTWSRYIPKADANWGSIQNLQFLNASLGFMNGEEYVFRTTDGGESWHRIGVDSMRYVWRVQFNSADEGIATGLGMVRQTTNGGATWRTVYNEGGSTGSAGYFLSKDVGFVARPTNGTLLYTVNGGARWDSVATVAPGLVADIKFFDDLNGYVLGNRNGVMLRTSDGGLSWERVRLKLADSAQVRLARIVLLRDQRTLMVGGNGILMKGRSAGPIGDVKSIEQAQSRRPNPYLYVRVTPNPVANAAMVEAHGLYSVRGKPIRVIVSDIMGRVVSDLTSHLVFSNRDVQAQTNWDTRDLPEGIYMVSLIAGGESFTRRVSIVR